MSQEKNDSGSIAWLVVKCGLKILVGLSLILLVYVYPNEVISTGAIAVAGIAGFFGSIFGLVGRLIAFIGTTPWLAILGMVSIYAWGICVAVNLKRRNQECDGYHNLRLSLHRIALVIWLISLIKTTQIDLFCAIPTFFVGGFIYLIHWHQSCESEKILARRNKLRNLKAARLGKRWS